MAKIKIPESTRAITTYREVEIGEGELILLLNRHRVDENGLVKLAVLGVFGEFIEEDYYKRKYIKVLSPIELRPDNTLGILPHLSKSEEYRTFMLTSQIKQIYSPQEQIIQVLQTWPGFEAHAEWISKLTKPYLKGGQRK